jgi:hypothetical protein
VLRPGGAMNEPGAAPCQCSSPPMARERRDDSGSPELGAFLRARRSQVTPG